MFQLEVVHAYTSAPPSPNMQVIWKFQTRGEVHASPAIDSSGSVDVVYIGSRDFSLYALNGATGALIWAYPTEGEVRTLQARASVSTSPRDVAAVPVWYVLFIVCSRRL